MVLDGVKEKYELQKEIGFYSDNSSFILCDCFKIDNKYILKEIIPLSNRLGKIKIDRENLLITDTEGKILKTFDSREINNTSIEYVNNNDLIISNYSIITPNFVAKKLYRLLDHYHYDDSLDVVTTLYDNNDGKLINFELLNEDKILINTDKNFEPNYKLYSISKKEYICPTFIYLKAVEKTNYRIFQFTDIVSSTLKMNNIKYSSRLIGFITIDGRFYNGVYDELSNKEIECELNSKPNFEEYYELRNMIQGKLNEKVIKEANKNTTRDFIIKKLENKAKNIIK